jgi:DNA-binding NarL/FixJ family response regulator
MDRLRIAIADDNEIFRRGIRSLLEARSDWEVCAEASTGSEALDLVHKFKANVLLLDVNLPDNDGIDVARTARLQFPGTKILILAMDESPTIVGEALAAGARGLVYKSDVARDLIDAINAISQNKPFVSHHVKEMILKSSIPGSAGKGGLAQLTEREMEVLKLLAQGERVKEIATDLQISPKTVNIHRARIMEKLQLHSVADLIYFSIHNQILDV